jgi:hypothetical protein
MQHRNYHTEKNLDVILKAPKIVRITDDISEALIKQHPCVCVYNIYVSIFNGIGYCMHVMKSWDLLHYEGLLKLYFQNQKYNLFDYCSYYPFLSS